MSQPRRPGPFTRLRAAFDRWKLARIADPAFQAWATRFPLTRPIVRSEARQLFDIVAGFSYSQVLAACVTLDVFAHLATPRDVADLAPRLGLSLDATMRLVQAATALRLLARRGERYQIGPLGAALLGAPGVAEMVRHHALFYRDLADPVALLRGETDTELARYWSYVGGAKTHAMTAAEAAPYSRLMAASQTMVAAETLRIVPLTGIAHLLDVGGGEGVFLEAAARRAPYLRITLFDLPAVAARGERRLTAAGLGARARIAGGSFLDDPLPEGCDAISLVRVLYDHDDDIVARLLARVHDALPAGGLLIVSEPMSGGLRPSRSGDAYFAFYTLAMGTGRPRSVAEHHDLLTGAGFEDITHRPTGQSFITQVMTARRGSSAAEKFLEQSCKELLT